MFPLLLSQRDRLAVLPQSRYRSPLPYAPLLACERRFFTRCCLAGLALVRPAGRARHDVPPRHCLANRKTCVPMPCSPHHPCLRWLRSRRRLPSTSSQRDRAIPFVCVCAALLVLYVLQGGVLFSEDSTITITAGVLDSNEAVRRRSRACGSSDCASPEGCGDLATCAMSLALSAASPSLIC